MATALGIAERIFVSTTRGGQSSALEWILGCRRPALNRLLAAASDSATGLQLTSHFFLPSPYCRSAPLIGYGRVCSWRRCSHCWSCSCARCARDRTAL